MLLHIVATRVLTIWRCALRQNVIDFPLSVRQCLRVDCDLDVLTDSPAFSPTQPDMSVMDVLLAPPQVSAIYYMPYVNYAGMGGKVEWSTNGKPVVGARHR